MDIDKLRTYAESIDLFRAELPPEVIQISKYRWHRSSTGNYVLLLADKEHMVVGKTGIGNWYISGSVNGNTVMEYRESFQEALKEADYKVHIFAGRGLESMVKPDTPWHSKPPLPSQLTLLELLKILVPVGATRGEVSAKISHFMMNRKKERALQERAEDYSGLE